MVLVNVVSKHFITLSACYSSRCWHSRPTRCYLSRLFPVNGAHSGNNRPRNVPTYLRQVLRLFCISSSSKAALHWFKSPLHWLKSSEFLCLMSGLLLVFRLMIFLGMTMTHKYNGYYRRGLREDRNLCVKTFCSLCPPFLSNTKQPMSFGYCSLIFTGFFHYIWFSNWS